ncbi:MAG TPA: helix-turn-helix domain-containing protein [Pseudonocardia sp.]|jgi:AcrR family transcriptional regulator|nr:helix-turn-helix domain-containing protein [Pseudonocardia sp.]
MDQIPEPGPRRRYASEVRRAQAERTRAAVLDAGRELITAQGYARTTMRQVAERAGVAVETVYLHFRTKPALLNALLDLAHGTGEQVPVAERDWVRAVRDQPDATHMLDAVASGLAAVYESHVPLYLAVRSAVDTDLSAAQLWATRTGERLAGMASLAEHLTATGETRPGLDHDEMRDLLFTLASPETYGQLVLDRGWTPARYAAWLARTLGQQLLG